MSYPRFFSRSHVSGNVTNDWTRPDGTEVEMPKELVDRLRKPGTDFCKEYYCIREKKDSIFDYPEEEGGRTFDKYNLCELPYDHTLERYMRDVPDDIKKACGTEFHCIMDAMNGGLETVVETRAAKLIATENSCNNIGGECALGRCCPGLDCIDMGLAGKECRDTVC